MKKIIALVVSVFIIFILLVYISVSGTPERFATCEIKNFEDLETVNFRDHDSVLVAPSTLYKAGLLKEFMQGENYRKAWSVPVRVPIAFLDTLKGGLEVIKAGGGKQTHSLKLKTKEGILYTLRSVTKDPEKLIPEVADDLGLENIIVDGISAQHPYAAILAAKLAELAGIVHTHPIMYFIPTQKTLGEFNEKYGNRLYLLEYETESDKNWTRYEDVIEIIETKDLQELKHQKQKKLKIDKKALIRVRLFDLLIGDWDRHAEQWGWALQKKDTTLFALPIAGDRDNAFFNPGGLLPSIITNKNIEPLVRPFRYKIDHMPGLVYPFDRYFLIDAPENYFVEEARSLQDVFKNEAIENAFKVWPAEISKLDKREISDKLKSRRDDLVLYAKAFHAEIQQKGVLEKPLKGSEDIEIPKQFIACFECGNKSVEQ